MVYWKEDHCNSGYWKEDHCNSGYWKEDHCNSGYSSLVSLVLLLLALLLGDTAGDCAASQHREGVTFLPLCYHSQVMRVGMGGEGGGRG